MSSNHSDEAQYSEPKISGSKRAFDRRPLIVYQQSFPDSRFRKSRIPLSVNRSKLSIPYKSQLCNLYQQRRCYYGENCHFAHNLSDIKQLGFKTIAMKERVSERDGDSRRLEEYCHYFSTGKCCPYGDKCQFLHKCDENVERNETGLNLVSDRNAGNSTVCRNLSEKSIFHKTRLCTMWEDRYGSCHKGEKCNYAHGIQELREVGYYAKLERSPDLKLKPDSQPSFVGSCKIGVVNAMAEGVVPIMDWNIAKISEIYADWMGVGHDFSMID